MLLVSLAVNPPAQALASSAMFRFYAELNDFAAGPSTVEHVYAITGEPTLGDALAALGVPTPAVELVLVNGESAALDHRLRAGDRVSVYPMFESFDVRSLLRLRAEPLRRNFCATERNQRAAVFHPVWFHCRHESGHSGTTAANQPFDPRALGSPVALGAGQQPPREPRCDGALYPEIGR
jgi:hypothetical protein